MGSHYTPRHLLRGFADSTQPNSLWQFDKQTRQFTASPIGINSIAQEAGYYDPQTEKDLNTQIEIPGNRVIDKLRTERFVLNDQQKNDLTVYIACLIMRVPKSRERGEKIAPLALPRATAQVREDIRNRLQSGLISEETAAKQLAEVDETEARLAKAIPAEIRQLIDDPWPRQDAADCILNMDWHFAVAPTGAYFITSDNPAFFFDCFGLGKEKSEFTFPISSSVAIYGTWKSSRKNQIIRQTKFVKEANRRIISAATRFVYSGWKGDFIPKVAAKTGEQLYLSRIQF